MLICLQEKEWDRIKGGWERKRVCCKHAHRTPYMPFICIPILMLNRIMRRRRPPLCSSLKRARITKWQSFHLPFVANVESNRLKCLGSFVRSFSFVHRMCREQYICPDRFSKQVANVCKYAAEHGILKHFITTSTTRKHYHGIHYDVLWYGIYTHFFALLISFEHLLICTCFRLKLLFRSHSLSPIHTHAHPFNTKAILCMALWMNWREKEKKCAPLSSNSSDVTTKNLNLY